MTSTAGISANSRTGGSLDAEAEIVAGEEGSGKSVIAARVARTTVPAYVRDSKWSPAPTASLKGLAVRSQLPKGS